MEENIKTNIVTLRGVLAAAPKYSHESRGESFYRFPLEVRRLSGVADTINIIARDELLEKLEPVESAKLCVSGEVRSFNNKSGDGPKLVITVFARELWFENEEDENSVELIGTICKPPTLRSTPMGREICDLMLAVNRRYGRSDYLPCISWGLKAREASEWPVGTKLHLRGRIQSRKYTKLMDGEAVEKTAFEISVMEMERQTENT